MLPQILPYVLFTACLPTSSTGLRAVRCAPGRLEAQPSRPRRSSRCHLMKNRHASGGGAAPPDTSAVPELAERRKLDQNIARCGIAGPLYDLGESPRVFLGHQPEPCSPLLAQLDPLAGV